MPIGSNTDPFRGRSDSQSHETPVQPPAVPEQAATAPVPAEQPPVQSPAAALTLQGQQNNGLRIVQRVPGVVPVPQNQATAAERIVQSSTRRKASRHIGRKVTGALVGLSLVGGAAYDFGMNHGRLTDSVISKIFKTKTGSAAAAEASRPNDTKTPDDVTATTAPVSKTTKPTPTSTKTVAPKPTKSVVVPIVPAAETCVDKLPDATLIAQKIMAPVYGDNLTVAAKEFETRHVGGAILMTSPKNPDDGSILAFKKAQSIAINVATDQEGGDPSIKTIVAVSRIKAPVTALEPKGYMPVATDMAKMRPDQIAAMVGENYTYLKSIGIDTSFGPVVDVAPANAATVLGNGRTAGADPAKVITYAASYIAGAKLAGVNPVVKHWGLGSVSANPDTAATPPTSPPLSDLEKRDFTVYDALKATGVQVDGMIGSEAIPGLTVDAGKDKKLGTADDIKTPASLSPAAVAKFKSYLMTGAVTYTDALGTPAIASKMSIADASVTAWKNGVDVALFVGTNTLPKSATNMTVPQELDATIVAGEAALKDKTLDRSATVVSVARLLVEKHVDGCALLQKQDPNAYKALTTPKPTTPAPKTPQPVTTTSLSTATATSKVTVVVKNQATAVATGTK